MTTRCRSTGRLARAEARLKAARCSAARLGRHAVGGQSAANTVVALPAMRSCCDAVQAVRDGHWCLVRERVRSHTRPRSWWWRRKPVAVGVAGDRVVRRSLLDLPICGDAQRHGRVVNFVRRRER